MIWLDFGLFVFLSGLFFYVFAFSHLRTLHKVYLIFHSFMMLWPLSQFALKTTDRPEFQSFYASVSILSISFQSAAWLIFTFLLTGQSYLITRMRILFIIAPALIIAALVLGPMQSVTQPFVNPSARLMYSPILWLLSLQLLVVCAFSISLMYRVLRAGASPRHRKLIVMALKGLVLLVLFILSDFLVNVAWDNGLPDVPGITSVGLAIAGSYFVFAIQRQGVFDIVQVAQHNVIQSMSAGVMVLDEYNVVVESNKMLKGYHAARIGDKFDMAAFLKRVEVKPGESFEFLRKYGKRKPGQIQLEFKLKEDNQVRYIQMNVSPVVTSRKTMIGRVVTFQDISEIRSLVEQKHRQNETLQIRNRELIIIQDELYRANQMLEQLAITDSLTGCYNRRFLMQQLEHEMLTNARYKVPFAIFLFDIDWFKSINDTFGHLMGDEVIKGTAAAVRNCLRRSDLLARYGGEEFTVYLPHTASEQAVKLAEKVKAAVERNYFASSSDGSPVRITISMGVLTVDPDRMMNIQEPKAYLQELFAQADAALYEAKRSGRNCIVSRKHA
ncbi:diguanylate cyclase [Paenibacillus beijingensis]|uniref:GGDEF domain-containing protein n=1 Tax=Paenibacillus beijingensis TaxID=1126833 RepID=A0A0D5NS01_9BACL|nr:diguanylate cyclase [Paenibacillus beijingensis]AJY77767.1 hypothetical protein VN24_15325 [Paenibacillus beijingensis]